MTKKKIKTSLKKKTFKPAKVVENATSSVEKKSEKTRPKQVTEAIDRLKHEVGKAEALDKMKPKTGTDVRGKESGVVGGAGPAIQKHWN